MVGQLFSNPRVMLLVRRYWGCCSWSGMPNLVFLLFTAGLLALAWWMRGVKKPQRKHAGQNAGENRASKPPGMTFSWKIHWEWKWAIA
jgi:flagellar biosynthesis protein FlhA